MNIQSQASIWEIAADATATLIVADRERMASHVQAVDTAGGRVVGQVTPEEADTRIDRQITLGLVLFDTAGMAPQTVTDTAQMLARRSSQHNYRIVALLGPDMIDAVASPLLGTGATLLCDATDADRHAALLQTLPSPTGRLHDVTREREAERLRLLNEEVARLAEVLSQLATPAVSVGVGDNRPGYRADTTLDPEPSARTVRATIRVRRMRDQHFPSELFADPAWDMLLDLYAARLEGRRVSVSSLCIAAAVPPTTALRWIGTMHDADLFGREADPTDRRRAHIRLTDRAASAMRGYFAATARAGLAIG